MDKIVIKDLKVVTIIGTHPWERQMPQPLFFDLDLETDCQTAAESDDIADALDYQALTKAFSEWVLESQSQLIEHLADNMAKRLLSSFNVSKVTLTLRKPGAIPNAKEVGVHIERTQV